MSRIDKLIAAMTLAEKLGQLTMTASSYAVTGPEVLLSGDHKRIAEWRRQEGNRLTARRNDGGKPGSDA